MTDEERKGVAVSELDLATHLFRRLAPRGRGRMTDPLIRFFKWEPPTATWLDADIGKISLSFVDGVDDDVRVGPNTAIRAKWIEGSTWRLSLTVESGLSGLLAPESWAYVGRIAVWVASRHETGCPTCGDDVVIVRGFFTGKRLRSEPGWIESPRPQRSISAECQACGTPVNLEGLP